MGGRLLTFHVRPCVGPSRGRGVSAELSSTRHQRDSCPSPCLSRLRPSGFPEPDHSYFASIAGLRRGYFLARRRWAKSILLRRIDNTGSSCYCYHPSGHPDSRGFPLQQCGSQRIQRHHLSDQRPDGDKLASAIGLVESQERQTC
jgi:hypothetical protein